MRHNSQDNIPFNADQERKEHLIKFFSPIDFARVYLR